MVGSTRTDDDSTQDPLFTEVRTVRLYELIIEQIAGLAERGELRIGDRFPPERELQKRWRVSRPVLREAFRVLERQGVVEVRAGGGRYLRTSHIASVDDMKSQTLLATRDKLLFLWEVREPIERMAARMAALRATDAQVAAIFRPLELHGEIEPEEFRLGDFNLEFHLAVAKATNNPFTESVLRTLIDQARDLDLKKLLPLPNWHSLQTDHIPIANAIRDKDPDAADAAMAVHFDELRATIKTTDD